MIRTAREGGVTTAGLKTTRLAAVLPMMPSQEARLKTMRRMDALVTFFQAFGLLDVMARSESVVRNIMAMSTTNIRSDVRWSP